MPVTLTDPVPEPLTGEPNTVISKATSIRLTADALRNAIDQLRTLTNENVTISDAVDEVRVKAEDAIGDIEKVEIRYRGAGEALGSYGSELSSAHSRADGARDAIEQNNIDARYWRQRFNTLEQQALSGDSSETLADDLREARQKVDLYREHFTSAMSQYQAAVGDKDSAVRAAMHALHEAREAADLDDGFWDRVGAAYEAMYEWAQEHLGPILEALRAVLEVLKSIVDILALIVTILAIFIPVLAPLAALLTLVSVALSALILLSSFLLFLLGRESIGRVLGDAIGLVTSVITARMGGLNVFAPGAKLAGLSTAFSRTAIASDIAVTRVAFAISHGVGGLGGVVGDAGIEIAAKLFDPAKLTVKLTGGVLGELAKAGGDFQLDFFPEGGNGGGSPEFTGGIQLDGQEVANAILKPVANAISGGASNPIISMAGGINTLVGAS